MNRIDLYVSPEDYAEVEALGACWDERSKCWYLGTDTDTGRFAAWLPSSADDEAFNIQSDRAYVACARTACCRCRGEIEVVCIYCESGTASTEPLERFTVHELQAVDCALARQLERWPGFRFDARAGYYLNHCSRCGACQDDADLHSEPDQPFYDIAPARQTLVTLAPLAGSVQLSGDYSVAV